MIPADLVEEIDGHFREALKAIKTVNTPLYEEVWQVWSGKFNRPIWEEIKSTDDPQLKYVYAYWWNRNNLLRLYNKSRIGLIARKKKLVAEGEDLRGLIKRVPKILERFDEDRVVKNIDAFLAQLGAQNEETKKDAVSFSEVETKPPT